MGVDFFGMKSFRRVPEETDTSCHLTDNDDFPGRSCGIETGHYEGERVHTDVRASYGGYNNFRRCVAALFGRTPEDYWSNDDAFRLEPFGELIHFSDCEGVLGPDVCVRLAEDFKNHEKVFCDKNPDWARFYRGLMKLFTDVGPTGCVEFT